MENSSPLKFVVQCIPISIQLLHDHLFSPPYFLVWHSIQEPLLHVDIQDWYKNDEHVFHLWHDTVTNSFHIKFAMVLRYMCNSACMMPNKFMDLPHLEPLDKCILYSPIAPLCRPPTFPNIKCIFDTMTLHSIDTFMLYHLMANMFVNCWAMNNSFDSGFVVNQWADIILGYLKNLDTCIASGSMFDMGSLCMPMPQIRFSVEGAYTFSSPLVPSLLISSWTVSRSGSLKSSSLWSEQPLLSNPSSPFVSVNHHWIYL